MPSALPKLETLKKEIDRLGLKVDLEVDGGINGETAPLAIKAGANVLVAGNYLFTAENMGERIRKIKELGQI